MTRRISLFGGPGCGKSTLSHRLAAELKIRGRDVEHVSEYVKQMAYDGRKPEGNDQLYIFSKQLKFEERALKHVSHVVTDSPVLLATAYAVFYGYKPAHHLIGIAQQFDEDYEPLNLFLERNVSYVEKGRFQNYDEAVAFDEFLLDFLDQHLRRPLISVKVTDFDHILGIVERAMDGRTDS